MYTRHGWYIPETVEHKIVDFEWRKDCGGPINCRECETEVLETTQMMGLLKSRTEEDIKEGVLSVALTFNDMVIGSAQVGPNGEITAKIDGESNPAAQEFTQSFLSGLSDHMWAYPNTPPPKTTREILEEATNHFVGLFRFGDGKVT